MGVSVDPVRQVSILFPQNANLTYRIPIEVQIKSNWLPARRDNQYAKARLFCLPYAGGSEIAYRTWQKNLPQAIEVLSIQLPGRGVRIKEAPYTRLVPLVETLGPALVPELDLPFAFFGHSMGALIAFELAHWLRREQQPLPLHLFISAKTCPAQDDGLPIGASDSELINLLRSYEGTPAEILENAELMEVLLPTIRADLELCQTYVYETRSPLECPITVFGGVGDSGRSRVVLERWKDYTVGPFKLHMFPGGHFFIQNWERTLAEIVERELAEYVPGKHC